MTDTIPRWRRVAVLGDRVIAPVVIFSLAYFASLLVLAPYVIWYQWAALTSVVIATAVAVLLWEKGRGRIGFFVRPRVAIVEGTAGLVFAIVLIGTADLLITLTTGMRHSLEGRFPGGEVLAVFLPAVFHEELLFRGYPFQKLWRWRPLVAVVLVSIVFAALHAANTAVTPVGLLNVFLGGVLLSYAYARHERLWFPIGLHLGWNLMSGPVLGYEVSGYPPAASILDIGGGGPALLTGGRFGIEGSLWMTAVEILAIVALLSRRPGAMGSMGAMGAMGSHLER